MDVRMRDDVEDVYVAVEPDGAQVLYLRSGSVTANVYCGLVTALAGATVCAKSVLPHACG